jgi:hypothetical protein
MDPEVNSTVCVDREVWADSWPPIAAHQKRRRAIPELTLALGYVTRVSCIFQRNGEIGRLRPRAVTIATPRKNKRKERKKEMRSGARASQ